MPHVRFADLLKAPFLDQPCDPCQPRPHVFGQSFDFRRNGFSRVSTVQFTFQYTKIRMICKRPCPASSERTCTLRLRRFPQVHCQRFFPRLGRLSRFNPDYCIDLAQHTAGLKASFVP